ncbi:MAG: hypothetical protein LRY51_05575 [Geovibrio sp.]|nr:hypothetical protein [Geovibrio sp.]
MLDFMNNPRTAWISFFSGAVKTVGYATSRRKRFYNTPAERLDGRPGETKLSLLAPFVSGFMPENHDTRPKLFTSVAADKKSRGGSELFRNKGHRLHRHHVPHAQKRHKKMETQTFYGHRIIYH